MALGGILTAGFAGRMVGGAIAPQNMGLVQAGMGITGVVGLPAGIAVKSAGSMLMKGTQFTNPMFNNVTGQAYGKRGIDANRLATKDLTLSLHKNRRRHR